ncbi:hypothetical protein Clacol_004018 [Clathrus columnatus]|uniref:Uncharacterized protein n=1 Tax=Clathrus columnatus TaxID=1419009 RepID=A0AAV5A595_9AGAM|nr:hypothetical protein Clacol_004018 [Clathrus columnatus]
MPFLKPSPRHFSLFAIAASILLLFLILLSGDQVLPSYTFVPYPFIRDRISGKCDLQCLPDPFEKPGMLYHGSDVDVSNTRWIPFPQSSINNGEFHSSAIFNDTPPAEALEGACLQYMKQLSRNDSEMDWVRDRTVLFIGSSHDRNNIRNFCQEVHGTYSTIGDHTAGACRLERYGLVLAFWFLYGVIDSDNYDWFSPAESRPLTFESRIKEIMIPWMTKAGIKSPDLVIETSLFWDDGFLKQVAHSNRKGNEAFTYSELAWHRFRIRALVSYTRSLFGSDIPIMLRTRHFRESNKWNRVLSFYDGDQHFKHGPVTWLFGE